MYTSRQIYSFVSNAAKGAVLSIPVTSLTYAARYLLSVDQSPALQRDEIIRPPLAFVLYHLNAYCYNRLGIENKALPYISTIAITALWEVLEHTPLFDHIVDMLSLGPTLAGSAIDIGMDSLMLALIYYSGYIALNRYRKPINPPTS